MESAVLHERILRKVLRAEAWRRERVANYFRFAILTIVGLTEWQGRIHHDHPHLTAMPFVLIGWGVAVLILNLTFLRRHYRDWFPAAITTVDMLVLTTVIRIVYRHAVAYHEPATPEIERAFLGLFVLLSANAIRFSVPTTLWSGVCAYASMLYLRLYSGTLGTTAVGTDMLAIGGFVAILMYSNKTVRTVTERLMVDLRRAQERRLSSLRSLVAGVMHEMNSPLGAIDGNAQVSSRATENLRQKLGAPPPDDLGGTLDALAQSSASTREAAVRISSIVTALRDFARVDEADLSRTNLRGSLDTCLQLLADDMGDRIEVERRYDDLPDVLCNAAQINQALMHVLKNAVQAIEGRGRIAIDGAARGDDAVVTISDTGSGIPAAKLPGLFDLRLASKGSRVGLGLGLPIAHTIIQDHGGSISVESALGKGTSVTIRLPAYG